MHKVNKQRQEYIPVLWIMIALLTVSVGFAQESDALEDSAVYNSLKAFELQGKATVSGLSLKRDRGEMTFTGDFYFAAPVDGRVTGAVFIGKGTFRSEAPPFEFEKDSLRQFLDTDVVESDFKTAVLRFTDDTFDIIGKGMTATDDIPGNALDLAEDLEPRLLKETGANISARMAVSIANEESPGVFLAQFDKGKLDRFTFLIDPQGRILNSAFQLNAGEKVVVFRYASYSYDNDIWISTYSEDDFEKGTVHYSDEFDVVNPLHYEMEIDLRKARRILQTKMRIDFESLTDNLRAIPMIINDGLSARNDNRLDDSMRVQSARYRGQDIPCIQEDWEMGLTFLLPEPMQKGEKFSVTVALDGDFIADQEQIKNSHYPQGNSSWYPRHGFLKRSTFDLTFRHNKGDLVSSVGTLVREEEWPDDSNDRLTQFIMDTPVAFVSFVAGILERHSNNPNLDYIKMDLDFYSLPTSVDVDTIKEEFVLDEFGNVLNYFSSLYGQYPYKDFRSTFRPGGSGQGFATLVMIPKMDEANRDTFSFIASETSKQWWGNILNMRSYRDQWIQNGFTKYSGLLYTLTRDSLYSQKELIKTMRYNLEQPPRTDTGVGKGNVVGIGPLILGKRLQTRNSTNALRMISDKSALVIRMLHYVFSNPSTGDDTLFFQMLKDFTSRFGNKTVNTNDFQMVASAYFKQAPIAQAFGLQDLGWFFQQWIYEAKLPSYRMEYQIESGEGNQSVITGKIIQENAGEKWFMPLPVVLEFPGDQKATVMVWANGPETALQIPPLPMKPDSVELDPDLWILSENTETKKK